MYKLSFSALLLGLLAASSANAADSGVNLEEGKKVYDTTCARCHKTGTMGAPVVGNAEDWAGRDDVVLWSDVLANHLDDGFVKTPAKDPKKGVSEEGMEAATAYILSLQQ